MGREEGTNSRDCYWLTQECPATYTLTVTHSGFRDMWWGGGRVVTVSSTILISSVQECLVILEQPSCTTSEKIFRGIERLQH